MDAVDEGFPVRDAVILLPAVVPLAYCALEVERGRPHLLVLGRAVRTEKLLALVDPSDGILGAVVLWETELVDGWRRSLGAAGVLARVKTALFLQELRLHVLDGGRQEGVILVNRGHLLVHLLADVADHLDHLVDRLVEGGLRDGCSIVFIAGHCSGCGGV